SSRPKRSRCCVQLRDGKAGDRAELWRRLARLSNAGVTRNRQEDERVFQGEAPLVNQQLGRLLRAELERVAVVVGGRVRHPAALELGHRPGRLLALEQVEADVDLAADLDA